MDASTFPPSSSVYVCIDAALVSYRYRPQCLLLQLPTQCLHRPLAHSRLAPQQIELVTGPPLALSRDALVEFIVALGSVAQEDQALQGVEQETKGRRLARARGVGAAGGAEAWKRGNRLEPS